MEKSGWKTLAIVFIILFILETALFGTLLYMGSQVVNNERVCAYEICSEATSYIYNDENKICECYKSGSKIKAQYMD